MSSDFHFKRVDSSDVDFRELVKLLDKDLTERYGDQQAFFSQFNHLNDTYRAVVVLESETPVGCGAIKKYDENTFEVKRMFVKSTARNKGLGYKILSELEKWAHEMDVKFLILETGINQPEAIHLYKKYGFNDIPNYDQYIGVEESLCMQLKIKK